MAYKTIDETFWTDPDNKPLSTEERLLFLYLITSPQAHYSGIYYLPESFIREEAGLNTHTIRKVLASLEDRIKYDPKNQVVWVTNMARHQMRQGNKKNLVLGIASHLSRLHNSPLIGDFLKKYADLGIPFTIPCLSHGEPIPESVDVDVDVDVDVKGEVSVEGKGESREEKPHDNDQTLSLKKELQTAIKNKDKEKIKELSSRLDEMDKKT
jgi:hypothetical protein